MKVKSIFRCLICNNPYFDYEKSHCSQCKDIIELSNNNDDDNNSKKRKSLKSPSNSVSNKKMFVDLVDEDDNNNNDVLYNNNNVDNNNNNNDDNNNNNNNDNNSNNNDDNNNNNNDDNNNNNDDNNNNNNNNNDDNNINNNYNAAILSSCSPAINTEIECDTDNRNNVVEEFYENNDELDFYDDYYDYDNTDNNMNTNMNTNMNNDKLEISIDDNKNENTTEDNDDDHCFICNHTLNDFSLDEKNSHIMDCLEQYEFSQSIKQQEDYENTDDSGLRSKNFFCVICDHNLSSKNLVLRCSHLKKCAKKFGISTKELLQMVSPSYDEFSVDEDDEKKDDNNIDKDDDDNDNNNDNHDSKDRNDNENNDINTKEQEPLKNAFTLLMTRAKEDGFIKPDKSTKSTSSSSSANAESGNAKNNTKYSRWNNWNNKKQSSDIIYAPKYKQIKFGQMQKPIIVDGFQYSNIALSDTYFLTHFHSDHYQGLDKHFNHGTIYCSPTTAGLVRLRLKVPSACIIPLELNKIHLVVAGGVNVKVVFLDANHCPGAVVILFFFESGQKVIHTGDFRWNNKLLKSSTILTDLAKNTTNPKNLIIYLDTTYCDPQYNFPAQEKCILSCLSQVQNEIENDEAEKGSKKTLFVFGAYGIGKERVFMSIAANMNVKIFVEPSRYKAMMCFNDWTTQEKSLLTTNPNITNFWVVPMNKINFNSLTKLKFRKGQMCKRVVAFQPTGWTFTQSTNPEPALHSKPPAESLNNTQVVSNDSLLVLRSNPRDNNIIYSVPYSEHSSFGELIDFIRIFKPHKIIPTVKTSVENVQMQLELLTKYSNLQNKLVGTVDSKKKSEFH